MNDIQQIASPCIIKEDTWYDNSWKIMSWLKNWLEKNEIKLRSSCIVYNKHNINDNHPKSQP
jgi:hypothetical protein